MQTSGRSFAGSRYHIALCTTRGPSDFSLPLYLSNPFFCYDRYTSLGSTYNTFRNPALLLRETYDGDVSKVQSRERSSGKLYAHDSIS